MIEIKQLAGAINLDDPYEVLGKSFHRTARNIEFYGVPGNMRAQTVKGTSLIPNALLPTVGVNMTIGAKYDAVNQRIFFFNYNSAGGHGIYIYYTLLGTFATLIQTGANTTGDPLAFTPNRITSIDILYGDPFDGDLLFYVDSLYRPRKFNINRILAGNTPTPSWTSNVYSSVKNNFMEVIKAPPIMPPQSVYENDYTVDSNSLINALYQPAYTFIYDDSEESVLSSGGKIPLPTAPFDPSNNNPQTSNARIAIYVQTGDQNVLKIRIYGRQWKSGVTSDWFIIETLIKKDLGIADNTIYRYVFYNTGNYVSANVTFTDIDQDFVPQNANCQALLDGTTIGYAGITEGYNYINPTYSIGANYDQLPAWDIPGLLFFAQPNGLFTGSAPQITFYLTGVGTNSGLGNPTDLEKGPLNLYVKAKSSGTDVSFVYVNSGGARNIPTLLFSLRGQAASRGWVYVSNDGNTLTMYYPTGNVVLQSSGINGISSNFSTYKSPVFSFYPSASYQWGVVYRDLNGRTNGVISNLTGQIETLLYTGIDNQSTQTVINLANFTPPAWAAYYHVVRTDNLTYNKHLYWVTNQAFNNYSAASGDPSLKYAFLSITNIFDFNVSINQDNNVTDQQPVVKYDFAQGDRVRVLARYDVNGTKTVLNYDYAIAGVSINPNINGIVQIGTFLKIYYPAQDITASYSYDGTDSFQNYEILIYSYKTYNAEVDENVFNEIGEQYGIGNPGLTTAFHMGNSGDNLVSVSAGDIFYRQRNVPIGNTYYITVPQNGFSNQYVTKATVNDQGVISNASYEINQQVAASAGLTGSLYPMYGNTNELFWNKLGVTSQIRVRGSYNVNGDKSLTTKLIAKIVDSSNNIVLQYIIKSYSIAQSTSQASYTIDFDAYIPVLSGSKVWLIWANDSSSGVSNIYIAGFVMRMDVIKTQIINIYESSYSDIYNIVANSDNRPNIVDTQAKQTYFSTLFRYSEPYQLGTNINNTNRFYPNNLDEWTKEFGDVIRITAWQRELRVFQKRRTGHTLIYGKFIKDNDGNSTLVTTDGIISPNNIDYFEGNYGIGNQGCSLVTSGYQNYFVDPVRGCIMRLSLDGLKNLSEEFKMQSFTGSTLPNYLNNYTYQFGGNAVVQGVFNFKNDKEGEVIFSFQAGMAGTKTIPGQSLAFNEKESSFSSFYDFVPDVMVCAENVLLSFYNGNLYSHTSTSAGGYANFYGTTYNSSIQLIFNENIAIKKKYLAMAYQGNQIFCSPTVGDINTSTINQQTGLQQISQLLEVDYEIQENLRYSSLLYDANSELNPVQALVTGDYLGGNWISCNLVYRGNNFAFLYAPYVNYIKSPRNL